jgi:hypothetical protein
MRKLIHNGYFVNRGNWTAVERQMGRPMRAPDDHPGAPPGFVPDGGTPANTGAATGDSGSSGNNSGGNNGSGGGDSNPQNNSSQPDPFDGFWSSGGETSGSSPTGDAATSGDSSSTGRTQGDQGTKPNRGQELVQRLDNFPVAEVFTREVAEAMNQGDFKGANTTIEKNIRSAMKEVFSTNVGLMRDFAEVMTSQVKEMIDGAIGTQKNHDALLEAIPRAGDKRFGPVIRQVYDQALNRNKGDTAKALTETRSFLQLMSRETSQDLGLDVAPHDPHAAPPTRAINWLEELTAQ